MIRGGRVERVGFGVIRTVRHCVKGVGEQDVEWNRCEEGRLMYSISVPGNVDNDDEIASMSVHCWRTTNELLNYRHFHLYI